MNFYQPHSAIGGRRNVSTPLLLFGLVLALLVGLSSGSAIAATMRFAWTNYDLTVFTNALVLQPINQPANDGTYTIAGPSKRVPTSSGIATTNLATGLWQVYPYGMSNSVQPIVFFVPNDSGTYNFWDTRRSGGQFYVTAGVLQLTNSDTVTVSRNDGVGIFSLNVVGGGGGNATNAIGKTNGTGVGTTTLDKVVATNFTGNGLGLTNANANAGTNLVTSTNAGIVQVNLVTAPNINGINVTNMNASRLSTGTVPEARLGTSHTNWSFYSGASPVADFSSVKLIGSEGNSSVQWWDRKAEDSAGTTSIDWGNRTFVDTSGNVQAGWNSSLGLYGNGSGLTNLDADGLIGTVPIGNLPNLPLDILSGTNIIDLVVSGDSLFETNSSDIQPDFSYQLTNKVWTNVNIAFLTNTAAGGDTASNLWVTYHSRIGRFFTNNNGHTKILIFNTGPNDIAGNADSVANTCGYLSNICWAARSTQGVYVVQMNLSDSKNYTLTAEGKRSAINRQLSRQTNTWHWLIPWEFLYENNPPTAGLNGSDPYASLGDTYTISSDGIHYTGHTLLQLAHVIDDAIRHRTKDTYPYPQSDWSFARGMSLGWLGNPYPTVGGGANQWWSQNFFETTLSDGSTPYQNGVNGPIIREDYNAFAGSFMGIFASPQSAYAAWGVRSSQFKFYATTDGGQNLQTTPIYLGFDMVRTNTFANVPIIASGGIRVSNTAALSLSNSTVSLPLFLNSDNTVTQLNIGAGLVLSGNTIKTNGQTTSGGGAGSDTTAWHNGGDTGYGNTASVGTTDAKGIKVLTENVEAAYFTNAGSSKPSARIAGNSTRLDGQNNAIIASSLADMNGASTINSALIATTTSTNVAQCSQAAVIASETSQAGGNGVVDSAVIAGASSTATGSYSVSMGRRAKNGNAGVFMYADSQNADFTSPAADTFNVRAQGGANFQGGGVTTTLTVTNAIGLNEGTANLMASQTNGLLYLGTNTPNVVKGFINATNAFEVDVPGIPQGALNVHSNGNVYMNGSATRALIIAPNNDPIQITSTPGTINFGVSGTAANSLGMNSAVIYPSSGNGKMSVGRSDLTFSNAFFQGLTIQSNAAPGGFLTTGILGGNGCACFFWMSNATLYVICTNSLGATATTNKIGGL